MWFLFLLLVAMNPRMWVAGTPTSQAEVQKLNKKDNNKKSCGKYEIAVAQNKVAKIKAREPKGALNLQSRTLSKAVLLLFF